MEARPRRAKGFGYTDQYRLSACRLTPESIVGRRADVCGGVVPCPAALNSHESDARRPFPGLWSVALGRTRAQNLGMTTFAAPMVRDELDGVVAALCARFPNRARIDIEKVVAAQYGELAAKATVTAHLIPLTLNRSRRLLARGADVTSGSLMFEQPVQAIGSWSPKGE